MSELSLKGCIHLHAAAFLRRFASVQKPNEFGILVYHRVAAALPGSCFPTWNVTPRRLRWQLTGLLEEGFTPWPLRRALAAHHAGESIPPRVFVVTFDDGYANSYTAALPILRDLQVPATLFVATAYLDSDGPFPCDDWRLAGSPSVPSDAWRPLKSREVDHLMDSQLVEIGCHTHTHADFRRCPEVLREDLGRSQQVLRERFGIEHATFAFPYGTKHAGFTSPELVQVVRQAGLLCGLSTECQTVSVSSSPFDWGRFLATESDTPQTLAGKLDGWYPHLRSRWQAMFNRSDAHPPSLPALPAEMLAGRASDPTDI